MTSGSPLDLQAAFRRIQAAAAAGQLSAGAVENIRGWLTEPRYAAYVAPILEHIAGGQWKALDDAFWTVIPFGTGGRRGRMYPIGCNAINDRTIGESAQGLADYVKSQGNTGQLACAIAYDTRHNSRHFAELCAGIMVASGFKVYFLDDYRSTPELSFLVRYMKAPRIAEALGQIADRARAESWPYERFLEELLEREVFARQQQGGETRIRAAHFAFQPERYCG